MSDIKAIDLGPEDEKPEPKWKINLRLWLYDFWPVKKFYRLMTLINRSKRALHWAKFMWTNWDFDAHSIFPLLERKLLRIQNNLERGWAIQDPKDMKALRTAIKLAKRVSDEYHEEQLYKWHEKKWGNYRNDWPLRNSKYSRQGVNSEEQAEAERADLHVLYDRITTWRGRDEKLLFAIIQKYYRVWWD